MSESLKEKAKTLPEWHVEVRKKGETDCGCCSSIGTKDACCDCAVILSWHPKFIEVSVAQQEIDKLKTFRDNAYTKWCDSQAELERERDSQKQKLGQFQEWVEAQKVRTSKLAEEFRGYDGSTGDACLYQGKNDAYENILAKFVELLRE